MDTIPSRFEKIKSLLTSILILLLSLSVWYIWNHVRQTSTSTPIPKPSKTISVLAIIHPADTILISATPLQHMVATQTSISAITSVVEAPTQYTSDTPVPVETMSQDTYTPTITKTKYSTLQPTKTPTVYSTPVVVNYPVQMPMIGVETHDLTKIGRLDQIQSTGVHWIRYNGLLWSTVESIEGERNWEAVAQFERGLREVSSRGIKIILVVRSTPIWAEELIGNYCGPVRSEKFDAFAKFMGDLVARYSIPPYNIKYWEIGNEPDIDPGLVPPDSQMGCWGNDQDAYYGGGYYGEMLKKVYPTIKVVDPEAQVMIGGLLLDCDPTNPPSGKDCKSSLFLEGILEYGGAPYFDIVSFHGYPFYNGTLQSDENYPGWEERGGVVMGKINFLREELVKFGITKPLMHTESALLCPEWNKLLCNPPVDDFYEKQADYLVRLFIRNWAAGIIGTIWYQYEGPGWRSSGLVNSDGSPRPASTALKYLTNELDQSIFNRAVTQYLYLQGYEFIKYGMNVWVLWAADEKMHTIELPNNTLNVYDKYGNPIIPEDRKISVLSPIYVELGQ
jgi:hypothetical protein